MGAFRKLAVLAGAAEAARRYARKNPDKAGKLLDQAAAFADKQTGGKYGGQIRGAAQKAKGLAGIPERPGQPGHGQYGVDPLPGQYRVDRVDPKDPPAAPGTAY